jgi:ABC-type transporter Mla MlaB component
MNNPRGLAIGGEIDEDAYPALVKKLGELAWGSDEVHVDLTALQYCDLAGLRAIVRAATTGRTVVLHGLPEQLQTIRGILGWDNTPGLVTDNSPSGCRLPPANPGRSGRLRQHEHGHAVSLTSLTDRRIG